MSAPIRLTLLLLAALAPATVRADASCSATNDSKDQNCSISCTAGQAARCANGSGSSSPKCECTSN